MNEIQGMMDQVRNTPFDDIIAVYNGDNFIIAALTNKGVAHQGTIAVTVMDPDLLRVKIAVCWRQRNMIMGENQNLDGVLDAGVDEKGYEIFSRKEIKHALHLMEETPIEIDSPEAMSDYGATGMAKVKDEPALNVADPVDAEKKEK